MKTVQSSIAVLLTCHNRKEKTLRCLDSLFVQQGLGAAYNISVFLVDDKSTDGTGEAVRKQFPAVTVIPGNGELYWSKGMHLAWKTAAADKAYDFFLWLNDDVVLFPEAIQEMLHCHSNAKSESVICGSTYSEFTKEYTYGGSTSKLIDILPNGAIQECYYMTGNFILVSKKIFQSVGVIDNIFPHGIGDFDYGLRAMKKGFKIVIPGVYIGMCEQHKKLPAWCLRETPLLKRFQSLYSPLGYAHPKYFFIFEKRHFGPWLAMKHYLSIHLRALIPSLWK